MWFVLIGCLLCAAKLAALGPVANWSWWWVLSPFALAAAWWLFADAIGWTQRKAMERESQRVTDRRARHLTNMGLDTFDRKSGKRPPSN
jgi:small Trp-rich protein